MIPAIVLERLTRQYGSGANLVTAVAGVDLTIPAGQYVSVIGMSGSGKTTLLNLIAGLDVPSSGRVSVAGCDLATLSDDSLSDLRLQQIGIVFQSFNLLPTFTVEENVLWPLELLGVGRRAARDRAREILATVEIPVAALTRRPGELSGGEQQRVAIARAVVTGPSVLLADEPTGNLDSHTGRATLDLLRRLNRTRGVTVVMVTHDALAAASGDRTVELRDGRVIRDVQVSAGDSARVVPLRTT